MDYPQIVGFFSMVGTLLLSAKTQLLSGSICKNNHCQFNQYFSRQKIHMVLIQGTNRSVLINIVHFAVSSVLSPELVRRKALTPNTIELLNHCCRLVVNCLLPLEGMLQSGRTEQRNSINPHS